MNSTVKRIVIFTALAIVLAWIPCFILMAMPDATPTIITLVFAGCMFMPAIASILTRLITKEGFKNMHLKPKLKGNLFTFLAAWFGPSVLTLIGAVVYFLIFPARFAPKGGDLLLQTAAQSGMEPSQLSTILLIQGVIAVFIGGLLNFVPALGEELGWRGYLLPHLTEKFSPRTSIIISGVIWGVWHAPMIAMGHNYGTGYAGYPWLGIFAMIVFCVVGGSFMAWLALKTKSAIAPAIGHGALNAGASFAAYFTAGELNPFVGPIPTGFIGGIGYIIVGVICFIAADKYSFKAEEKAE